MNVLKPLLFFLLFASCYFAQTALGQSSPCLTSWAPTYLRTFNGFVGMKITVGSSDITVTELGRFCASGNSGNHTVKIVNKATGADVPNGSVTVSMAGGTVGQFKYVTLPSAVTLIRNTEYYIVSNESSSGDQWFDRATVTTTSAATCNTGVYWNGQVWFESGGTNVPYFTTNFKYTPGGGGSGFTNFFSSLYTGARHDHTGGVGYQFTPVQNMVITALGRPVSGTLSSNHVIRVWRVSDQVQIASATVTPSSPSDASGYKYAMLYPTVILTAGTSYRIVTEENATSPDTWMDVGLISNHSSNATIEGGWAEYGFGTFPNDYPSGGTNNGYAAPTFYTGVISNVSPTLTITSPTPGSTFTQPGNILINVSASDSDGTISKVEFYAGPVLLGTDTSSPYSITWSNVGAGTYNLTAKATDNTGAITTSPAVAVTVNSTGAGAANNYSGPVYIQPAATQYASLHVERAGSQPSALDVYAHSGTNAFRFWASDFSMMRSYITNTGIYFDQGWMLISGVYTGAPANASIQFPTTDPSMVEVWSNLFGPAVVIRPNQNNPPTGTNATVSTMDGDGKYRFSIFPDGSLNFAGANANTFSSAGFDTNLYRAGAGHLTTSGSFSALGSIKDTVKTVTLLNHSAVSVSAGAVLVLDPTLDGAFLPSSAQLDTSVVGIARQTIAAGASGPVGVLGIQQVSVTGAVNRGDRIVTGAGTAVGRRVAAGEVVPTGALIGKALTGTAGGGQITVLVTACN